MRHALGQVRVWVLGVFLLCIYIGNYGYAFTAPTIIQKVTGFTSTKVGFVVAVLGVLGAVSMLLNGAHSDRTRERHLHVIFPCLLIAAGYLGAGLSLQPGIALLSFGCIVGGFSALNAAIWTIPSSFLTGKSAAAGIATVNMIGMTGGFLGPYWMGRAADLAGGYQHGLLTLAVPTLVAAAIMVGVRRDALRRSRSTATPA